MKFCSLVLELHLLQNFRRPHRDTQTDRHFSKIFKSCSGHPKTCKPIKNWKSKICTKPLLLAIKPENNCKNCSKCWDNFAANCIHKISNT